MTDPQIIGIQAAALGVEPVTLREAPVQPRLIGGGSLPLESLPLFRTDLDGRTVYREDSRR